MKIIFSVTLIFLIISGISCSEETPVTPSQVALHILKLKVIPDSIKVNGTCIVLCITDALEKDSITYSWTAVEGIITEFGEYIEWTAPDKEGKYQIACDIKDQTGRTDSSSVIINVQKQPLSIIKLSVFPDNVITGELCTIACQINDPDYEGLIYTWSSSEGSFSGNGNFIEWHAPEIEGEYTIICQISDQTGNSDSSSININVSGNPALVFYSLDQKIYMTSENDLKLKMIGSGGYPIWLNSKLVLGYHSTDNFYYHIYDIANNQILKSYPISGYGTFTFGRYSEYLDVFAFSVNHHGLPALAIMDIEGNIRIIKRTYPLYNPAFSGVDDWMYYLNQADGSFDIFRMKLQNEIEESIAVDTDFRYGNFSVSYDGRYLVAPKLKDNFHLIAVINTDTREERIIDLSYLGLVGHLSFSKDMRYIFFTGGTQRDAFRLNFDGSGLTNLTKGATTSNRPMAW